MKTILSIIGLPGAGKSSVANAVSSALNVPALSTGDALRRVAQLEPDLSNALAEGKLGPELLVRRFVDEFVELHSIAILDGYPRHGEQAAYLLTKPARLIVAHLEIDPTIAMARIRQRPARGDDSDASIVQRVMRDKPAIDDVVKILVASVVSYDGRLEPTQTAASIVALLARGGS